MAWVLFFGNYRLKKEKIGEKKFWLTGFESKVLTGGEALTATIMMQRSWGLGLGKKMGLGIAV